MSQPTARKLKRLGDAYRSYWFPIDAKHSTVSGRWESLDWQSWWLDNARVDGLSQDYLHVETIGQDDCVFRVRCRYAAGNKYRGRLIYDVSIGCRGGKLHWIVRTRQS